MDSSPDGCAGGLHSPLLCFATCCAAPQLANPWLPVRPAADCCAMSTPDEEPRRERLEGGASRLGACLRLPPAAWSTPHNDARAPCMSGSSAGSRLPAPPPPVCSGRQCRPPRPPRRSPAHQHRPRNPCHVLAERRLLVGDAAPPRRPPAKPPIKPLPASGLLGRLHAFLPELQAANAALEGQAATEVAMERGRCEAMCSWPPARCAPRAACLLVLLPRSGSRQPD